MRKKRKSWSGDKSKSRKTSKNFDTPVMIWRCTEKKESSGITDFCGKHITQYRQKASAVDTHVYGALAGAEGFEPSARGFGVDVEKTWVDIQRAIFRTVEPQVYPQGTPHAIFDALLMISRNNSPGTMLKICAAKQRKAQ